MERQIGEIFTLDDGTKLQVKEEFGCKNCFFVDLLCNNRLGIIGSCGRRARKDGHSVIFVKIEEVLVPLTTEKEARNMAARNRERKVGEIFSLEDGTKLQVKAEFGCKNCFYVRPELYPLSCIMNEKTNAIRGVCSALVRSDDQCVIFVKIGEAPMEKKSIFSTSLETWLSGMADEWEKEISAAAQEAFVFRFWDMPNTKLARVMGIHEKTVRRIRKKVLRNNKETI
jgi:hypothetical protein